MSELLLLVEKRRPDVVNALRTKISLWQKGITVSGLAVKEDGSQEVPAELVEDLIQLRIIASLKGPNGKTRKHPATCNGNH